MNARRIFLLFLLFGGAWILLSDQALQLIAHDLAHLSKLQSFKGLAFVLTSGALVYGLVRLAERRQAELEAKVQRERDQLARIIDAAPAAVYALKPSDAATGRWRVGFIGHTVEALTGYAYEAWMTDPTLWQRNVHPDDLDDTLRAHAQLDSVGSCRLEYRFRHADGQYRWMHDRAVLERDVHGNPTGVVGAWLDVTARRQAEEHARVIARVFEMSKEGILITDARTRFLSVNKAFTEATGYSEAEVAGQTPALLKSGLQDDAFYAAMWKSLRRTGRWEGEIWNRRKSGEVFPEWLTISAIVGADGEVQQYLGVFTETTGRKADEAQIRRLSNYDALTGLPNRALLADRAQVALATAAQQRGSLVLMHLNIDGFGEINASLGHAAGDQVLQELSRRLTAGVEAETTLCRIGGDNFVVLLPGGKVADVAPLGLRLMEAVAEPLQVSERTFRLSTCIGVATYPDGGRTVTELMQAAESAVRQAKREGRGLLRIASRELQERVQESLELANDLRWALEKQQFLLHYQPQFTVQGGRVVGCEALLRWQHPRLGMVSPAKFIPIAEEAGLIGEIGRWVLREAVQQVAAWQAAGLPVVPVAVNLSAVQFRDPTLRATVADTLQDCRLDPSLLELELTESIAMEDSEFTVATIAALKGLGVQLSIDDFGTGYSSLNYLRRFAVDKLKIDRSFINGLGCHERDDAIVSTVIALARNLGLCTIAEGVEQPEQLQRLAQLGCDEVQGFLTGRPGPAADMAALLKARAVQAAPAPEPA